MKLFKQTLTLVVFALVIFLSGTVSANSEQEIASTDVTIEVFGDTIGTDVSPFISGAGRTMVPVRFPAEALGAEVEWDEDTQEVVINGQGFEHEGEVLVDERSVKMTIGEDEYLIDGVHFTHPRTERMDTEPFIIDGRTMVPLRFISEGLGYEVEWDESTRTVEIGVKGLAEAEDEEPAEIEEFLCEEDPAHLDLEWAYEQTTKAATTAEIDGKTFKVDFQPLPDGVVWRVGAGAWFEEDSGVNNIDRQPLWGNTEVMHLSETGGTKEVELLSVEHLEEITMNVRIQYADTGSRRGYLFVVKDPAGEITIEKID